MPHLTDKNLYVSNPDHILSSNTVNQLNKRLRDLDDSLGIESAVIIIKTLGEQKIFRFAQDIFDIYGVGKEGRGLVMVLAYNDHLFRSHTGSSLENDLTDVELSYLQENYLVPYMEIGQPDSGMIHMIDATYGFMLHKQALSNIIKK